MGSYSTKRNREPSIEDKLGVTISDLGVKEEKQMGAPITLKLGASDSISNWAKSPNITSTMLLHEMVHLNECHHKERFTDLLD